MHFQVKEQPAMRDMFAMHIAGVMLSKSDFKALEDVIWERKLKFHDEKVLQAIAFLSYALADKMMEERAKR